MLIKLATSVNFKEKHIENHLHVMHLTETLAVKLLPIIVSDVGPKQVLACILLIELTKIINFSTALQAHFFKKSPFGDL